MATPDRGDPQAVMFQTWRVIRGLWLAEAALVVAVWVAVPLVLPGPRETVQDGGLFALIFYAVGLVDIALGWWMRERALSPGRYSDVRSSEEILAGIFVPSLLAVAMSLTPAVLGVVHFAMFAGRGALSVLCVLSLIGLALARPNLERWQEILNVLPEAA